jgi:hypothetical protein
LLCPLFYVAIGVLAELKPLASLIISAVLFGGGGFLLWRFVWRRDGGGEGVLLYSVEAIIIVLISAVLFVVSNVTLLTDFERVGLLSLFFVLAFLIALPLVLIRQTALERQLRYLPKAVATAAALVILAPTLALMVSYLFSGPSHLLTR